MRHSAQRERITVSNRSTIIRLEDQPAVAGCERRPLMPASFEAVAIRFSGSAVDQRQHGQMLRPKPAGRIDQHSFRGCAVVSCPTVWFTLRKFAFNKSLIECRDRDRPV